MNDTADDNGAAAESLQRQPEAGPVEPPVMPPAEESREQRTSPVIPDWRSDLLKQIRVVLLAVLAITSMLIFVFESSLSFRIVSVLLGVSLVPAAYLSSGRFSYLVRVWTILSLSLAASLAALFFVGVAAGPALCVAFCLVFSALLLGRVVMVRLLLATMVVLFGFFVVQYLGWWAGPENVSYAAGGPMLWARASILSVLFWAGMAFSVWFVVSTIEKSLSGQDAALRERNQAVNRLRTEIRQRQDAEQAWREAQIIASQTQKLDALGRLAAGVAHDFNNALLVIQGWTALLRDDSSEAFRDKAIEAIDSATGQAKQLSDKLLIFGRQEVRSPSYLRASEVVADTAETLKALLPSNTAIRLDLDPEAAIYVDETQLRQLLYNLVLNSIDAMPDGGEIRLRTRCVAPADASQPDRVIVEVEDTGVGMDAETREQIFDPFFTTKGVGKGTGLGLSSVFGIVEQSDGAIDVWSQPGEGTRFSISFPRVTLAPDAAESSSSDEQGDGNDTDPVAFQGRRVLVVEDDPLVRQLIVFALSKGGFRTVEAADGEAALKALAEMDQPFDLLCTDAVFPGAPLAEVLEVFEDRCPQGGVLICSGYVPSELAIDGIESGRYGFLAKPFTAEQLLQKLTLVQP
ncbi:MAG: ATP-binding protein [Pseudomonadota bacterium]